MPAPLSDRPLDECPCYCHGHFEAPCSLDGGCGHLHNTVQDPSSRPESACALCPPPSGSKAWRVAYNGRTCDACFDRLAADLAGIAERYEKLDIGPGGAVAGDGTRGAPGFGSKPPANLHIVAMRDPRSSPDAKVWIGGDGRVHQEPENPPLSIWAVLDTLAWDVAEQRGFEHGHQQNTVTGLCGWLDSQLDWIVRSDELEDIAESLRQLLSQLKPVTGDKRRRIGACPRLLVQDDPDSACGAPLYAPTDGDTVRCRSCKHQWPRSEWLNLGDLLDAC